MCRNFTHFDKEQIARKQLLVKVANSGKLPTDFLGFCKTHIEGLIKKGEVYEAYNQNKKYHKLYPQLAKNPLNYDSTSLVELDRLIKKLNRNDAKIKAPDSLLWAKYKALNSFCESATHWFEYECGTDNTIALEVLKEFIKKYPQSKLIDVAEYEYIIETTACRCCDEVPFSQQDINTFENFIKKYPESKYKNKILEKEMHQYHYGSVKTFAIYKNHLEKALNIAKQLKKGHYKFDDDDNINNRINDIEHRIEVISWKAEISLSKPSFKKNEPIFYTLKIKNTGKKVKEIDAIDCEKQPRVKFILVSGGEKVYENGSNIFSFCQTIEPPKCPNTKLSFKPNEEKIFIGTLDNVAFYGGVKGTIKFLQTGSFGLEVQVFDDEIYSDSIRRKEYFPKCKFEIIE